MCINSQKTRQFANLSRQIFLKSYIRIKGLVNVPSNFTLNLINFTNDTLIAYSTKILLQK